MAIQRIVIIGAGGFAREVEWLLREIDTNESKKTYDFQGYVVSDLSKLPELERAGVLGDYTWLKKNRSQWDALEIGRAHV